MRTKPFKNVDGSLDFRHVRVPLGARRKIKKAVIQYGLMVLAVGDWAKVIGVTNAGFRGLEYTVAECGRFGMVFHGIGAEHLVKEGK